MRPHGMTAPLDEAKQVAQSGGLGTSAVYDPELLRGPHTRALGVALQAQSASAAQLQAVAVRSSKRQLHIIRSSGV